MRNAGTRCRSSTRSKRSARATSRARRSRWRRPRRRPRRRRDATCSDRGRSGSSKSIACSGQARMHALQRVQRSRSIGFSCVHSTSNAPSQPASFVELAGVDRESRARPAARRRSARPVTSTVTASCSREHAGPVQRGLRRTDDQQLALRLVGDARHRIGLRQRRQREQRGDLRRGAPRLRPTSRPFRGC